MLNLTATVCIEAPAENVWRVLSSLESIELWVAAIEHSYCPGQSRGVGAMRVCELKQMTIRETIVEWEEGKSFCYRGEGAPLMAQALNRWSITAQGSQTLVTSEAEVIVKGGFFGRLLEPLMRPMMQRLGARSLASLKYFVEHGQPYVGHARDLPAAVALC
jgi:carbon monoxide dehydrogenase subunit G